MRANIGIRLGFCGLLLLRSLVVMAADDSAGRPADMQSKMISHAWWNNDKKTENLALTMTQRTKMDGYLADYLKKISQLRAQRQSAMTALGKALSSGDQTAAMAQRDAMSRLMAQPTEQQIDMMIAVSGELSEQQRQTLVAQSPQIFSRFWTRLAMPTRGRRVTVKGGDETHR